MKLQRPRGWAAGVRACGTLFALVAHLLLAPDGLAQAPVIGVPPQSLTVAATYNAAFSVTASNATSYQWRKDGTDIPGATNASYTITNVQFSQAGNYFVVATNTFGAVNSTSATLTVIAPLTVSTWAGKPGYVGSGDAPGPYARFSYPYAPAVDSAGNVFVPDSGNHTIRKITPAGVVTTVAGQAGMSGNVNGLVTDARFNNPVGVAIDVNGDIYVADLGNGAVRKVTGGSVVSTLATLSGPNALTVDAGLNVYVADSSSEEIFKIAPGGSVTLLAGSGNHGFADGLGMAAAFYRPRGIVLDSAGNAYVTDMANFVIRKITPGGLVSTIVGRHGASGNADGVGTNALLGSYFGNQGLGGIAIDSSNNLYITDAGNSTLRKIIPTPSADGSSTNWVVTTIAGMQQGYLDGTGSSAQLGSGAGPHGVCVDASGTVFIAETWSSTIRKGVFGVTILTQPQSQTVSAGTNVAFSVMATGAPPIRYQWFKDGAQLVAATNAAFTLGSARNNDAGNYFVVVGNDGNSVTSLVATLTVNYTNGAMLDPRFIALPQSQTTLAGSNVIFSASVSGTGPFTYQWLKDGVALSGAINSFLALNGVLPGSAGNYSVVVNNSASSVTSSPPATLTVNLPLTIITLAGSGGASGTNDGFGSAARFYSPEAVAVDGAGNVYVSDYNNHAIRKITPAGLVTTLAGLPGVSGTNDGLGRAARFNKPYGVAVDNAGNVYVADSGNETVRKITPAGLVSTFAGVPGSSGTEDGPGDSARFSDLTGAAVDSAGNVFVAEAGYGSNIGGETIRKITPTGLVRTIAGASGSSGFSDGVGSDARFYRPLGVAADSAGDLYVADWANYALRKLIPVGTNYLVATLATGLSIPYGATVDGATNIYVVDYSGQTVRRIAPDGSSAVIAGVPGASGTNDGTGAEARFNYPSGIAADSNGVLYIADTAAHTIRKGFIGPLITIQPQGQVVAAGSNITLNVTALGFSPLSYQWRFNGAAIPGATNTTLALTNLQLASAGGYTVIVSNGLGVVTSLVASVTIPTLQLSQIGRGTITVSPAQPSYATGQLVTLTATPARYYTFLRWSDGVTASSRTIMIGASNNFATAIFTNSVPLEELVFKQWDRSFGGANGEGVNSVQQTSDGGFILGGYSSSGVDGNKTSGNFGATDYWVVKLDAAGNKLWETNCGGTDADALQSVLLTSDGGYLLGGSSRSSPSGNKTSGNFGSDDFWVVKIDASGSKLWETNFGGTGSDILYSLAPAGDGGYLLCGWSQSGVSGNKTSGNFGTIGANSDFWVVKVNASGGKQWEATYGGTGDDAILNVIPTSDGGFLLGGQSTSGASGNKTTSNFGDFDYWVVKIDANGSKQWEANYGGTGLDSIQSLTPAGDGGYILGGYSISPPSGNKTSGWFGGYDYWVIKIDANGNKQWETSYGGAQTDLLESVAAVGDGGYVLGGFSDSPTSGNKASGNFGGADCWVIKLNAAGSKQWEANYGGTNNDGFYSLAPTSDGGFVLGGYSASGMSGNKTSTNFGGIDFWVVRLATREAPVGMPAVLVNGQFSPSNSVSIPATNTASVTLTSTYPGGFIYYTLDGSEPDPDTSPSYDTPILLANSATVRAVAFDSNGDNAQFGDPVQVSILPLYSLADTSPGGGFVTIDPPVGPYLSNSVVNLTATPSNGWVFMRWEGDAGGISTNFVLTMNGPRTVRAVFGGSVSTNATITGGSVSFWPPAGPYPFGSMVRMVGAPTGGNYFRRWFNGLSGPATNPITITVGAPSTNVSAFFSSLPANSYSLTVLLNGSGNVTRSPQSNYLAGGASATLTAVPDSGSVFVSWSGDANSAVNPLVLVMNTNKTLTANFSMPPSVSITNPINASRLIGPNITIEASATDVDGTVSQVDFFSDTIPIGTAFSPPFSVTWSNAADGVSVLTARATDNSGLIQTSAPVSITVTSPPRIVVQPRSQATRSGVNPYFSVSVAGTGPFGYQWRFNGGNLDGETNFALFLHAVKPTNSGDYSVVVGNALGASTSAVAVLTITQCPPSLALVGWGDNSGSQLNVPGELTNVVAISAGGARAPLALRNDGTVLSWGSWAVEVPPGISNAVAIAGGDFLLNRDGTVIAWGGTPAPPAGLSNVAAIAVGWGGGFAIMRDGRPIGWGDNTYGKATVPPGLSNVVSIASHKTHTLALRADGTVIGFGNSVGATVPAGLSNVIAIAAGVDSSYALKSDGNLIGWGTNYLGAQPPAGLSEVAAVRATDRGGVALKVDGTIVTWGTLESLGVSNVPPPGLSGVLDIAASPNNGFVLTTRPGNSPPSVSLTNPAPSATFTAPASVSLAASASDVDGSVTQVTFFAGANLIAIITNAPFNFTWTNVGAGTYTNTAVATDTSGLSATSAPVTITVTEPLAAPLFQFSSASYSVPEYSNYITVTVLKSSNSLAGSVRLFTQDGLATAITNGEGDYVALDTNLTFAAGQTSQDVRVTIFNDTLSEGNQDFHVVLASPTAGALLNPFTATVTIIDDDVPTTTNSVTGGCAQPVPVPAHDGVLRVWLDPPAASGQWRLAWESSWRNSGSAINGLPSGNYTVEFKPVSNYQQPPNAVVTLSSGGEKQVTNSYLGPFQTFSPGSLKVNLLPDDVNQNPNPFLRAGWQLVGESGYHASGETVSNLNAGDYLIAFRPISGWVTPANHQETVFAGSQLEVPVNYLVGDLPPMNMLPVPFSQVQISAPYAYCGQIVADGGSASGTVVKERVVLTAAHVLFDDAKLTYAVNVNWFLQRQAGVYEPPPQAPRGSYVRSGYAAQRTNDMSPGVSTPDSRNLDAAAMYFVETTTSVNLPGRGCASGFLVSTPGTDEWLLKTNQQLLVGYPLESPNVSAPGQMYATLQANYAFTHDTPATNRVFVTTNIISAPGNSGGPLCVQYTDGRFYPAGIYLGGSTRSYVRSIDSDVVDLINRAEVSGNAGPNNTSGGVIQISHGTGLSIFCDGYVTVKLSPSPALAAGAAWTSEQRLANGNVIRIGPTTNNTDRIILQNGPFTLSLRDATGFTTPPVTITNISCGTTQELAFTYTQSVLRLDSQDARHLVLSGSPGLAYRVDYSPNLRSNTWTTFTNITLPATNPAAILSNALKPGFFRAVRP